jgi:VWFA-related protein
MCARQIILFATLIVATGHAQSQPGQPAVKTTTSGVIIDVSVVDNNGQPVLDLLPADFQLIEEGKQQRLVSVSLVNGGAARALAERPPATVNVGRTEAVAPGVPAPVTAVTSAPTVTAILFDKLSPEARPSARLAAHQYLSTLSSPRDYAGIFVADLSLITFQPFTNDSESLRRAIDRLAATAPANIDSEYFKSPRAAALDPNQPPTAGAESRTPGWVTAAERNRRLAEMDMVERMLAEMELRMEQGYRQMLAEYSGQASIAGLRSVIEGLRTLEGRKSVVYFTESLSVTSQQKAKFETLIGEANRANVTFYPVDALGLRVHSEQAKLSRNVTVAGSQGLGDTQRDPGPWTKELERQEQLLASGPSAVLGRLAKETGGFLIENTNNLAAGVARMQQERTTYYLLGYEPTNAIADGKFRRVTVKVNRRNVTVRARPGYLAVPLERQ